MLTNPSTGCNFSLGRGQPHKLCSVFFNFGYICSMSKTEIITIDQEIAGGQPVFQGTRVPVESLFDHLEAGVSLDAFLEDFPTVSREQAVAVLEMAQQLIISQQASYSHENLVG